MVLLLDLEHINHNINQCMAELELEQVREVILVEPKHQGQVHMTQQNN
jgi:hypothetical protein